MVVSLTHTRKLLILVRITRVLYVYHFNDELHTMIRASSRCGLADTGAAAAAGRRRHSSSGIDVSLQLLEVSLEFRSSVLKPRDDLRATESEAPCGDVAISRQKILLSGEASFELLQLVAGERRATLSSLLDDHTRRRRRCLMLQLVTPAHRYFMQL